MAAGRQRTDIGYRESSYKNLKHRRSVFFVDNSYFVIVDEMVGSQKGSINLHYQMPKGEIANSREDMTFVTQFEEGSNMKLQCFGPEGMTMKKSRAGAPPLTANATNA